MSTYCKYYKQKKQYSYDGGLTWFDFSPMDYRQGSLYESCSFDCGYPIGRRWVTIGEVCVGNNKYEFQKEQITYDSGVTWNDTPNTRQGELIEEASSECNRKLRVIYTNGETHDISCDLSSAVTKSNVTAYGYPSQVLTATIGDCVEVVGENAFQDCYNLIDVYIPENITEICNYSFLDCRALTGLTLHDGIESIGGRAFEGCKSIQTLKLPANLTYLGGWAFQDCSGLTDVEISSGLTSILALTFGGCDALTSVTFADNSQLTSIEQDVFVRCRSLSSITVPDSVTFIGHETFLGCINLRGFEIPSGVTGIENRLFQDCYNLTEINIHSGITGIGAAAFFNCRSLSSVTIPDSVTFIGDWAFRDCSGLTSVEIGSGVTYIGDLAFFKCSGLTDITINAETPPTLSGTSVFDYTNNCPIYVPCDKVNVYKVASGWSKYYGRIQSISSMTRTVTTGYTCIDNDKYSVDVYQVSYDCGTNWETTSQVSTLVERYSTDCGCDIRWVDSGTTCIDYDKYQRKIKQFSTDSGQTWSNVEPEEYSATTLIELSSEDCGFHFILMANYLDGETYSIDCDSSTTEVTSATTKPSGYTYSAMTSVRVGGCVETIGNGAFFECDSLSSVTLSNSITSIGSMAFNSCSGLTDITIGSGITYIGAYAMAECDNLRSVTVYATTPPTLGGGLLNNSPLSIIYVPASAVDTYKSASGWSNYANRIQAITE